MENFNECKDKQNFGPNVRFSLESTVENCHAKISSANKYQKM
jgi:hypothetical protein